MGMSPPDDLDRLSHAELKGLVVKQWEQILVLQRMVTTLRGEITRLKGWPGRPNLRPSGMERGTKPPGSCGERKRPRGGTRSHEERTTTAGLPVQRLQELRAAGSDDPVRTSSISAAYAGRRRIAT
jgi:hypothetical protein